MYKGLSSYHAQELLKQYGSNELIEKPKRTFLKILATQFDSPLIFLLIGAGTISFFINESVNAILILTIVFLNALFGIIQEVKAQKSIASLKKLTITKSRVIRDHQEQEINSRLLVPQDIILIEQGDKIPADAKLLTSVNLEVNEASLTGESLPVFKNLGDKIFLGTIVTRGRAKAIITKTGMSTAFGQIATKIAEVEDEKTPLEKKLVSISRILGFLGIIAAILVFFLSFFTGTSFYTSALLAIALAVAVVPEGLPTVLTIALSIGVKNMAKKKAILRKLSAIEALGSITLIATDKTGTLTKNQMRVAEIYVNNHVYPTNKPPGLSNTAFSLLLLNSALCSTSSLIEVFGKKEPDVIGDPTEGALLMLAQKLGLSIEHMKHEWKLVHEEPFDAETKRMSVIIQHAEKHGIQDMYVFTKGSPESILDICSLTDAKKMKIKHVVEEWGKKGLRVLAFAYKIVGVSQSQSESVKSVNAPIQLIKPTAADPPIRRADSIDLTDSTFLGLVALHDAPRPEAAEAVSRAHEYGIKVVMVTGDNEKTAEAIGLHTGIISLGDEVLTGQQLDNFSDEELLEKIERVRIFARTTPQHKHRIVKLFQKKGEIVAVTGDGINDAIALKQADVGVAMGKDGTDVARETADMIITDDNFATIITAIEEGRHIIKNLKNAIRYLIGCNLAEATALIMGMFLGISELFLAIQLLYINLVTDGIPALALVFSPGRTNPSTTLRVNTNVGVGFPDPQINDSFSLLDDKAKIYIAWIVVLSTVFILAAYFFYKNLFGEGVAKTAAFTTLILTQSFIFLDIWLGHRSIIKIAWNMIGNGFKPFSTLWHKIYKRWIFFFAFGLSFFLQYAVVTNQTATTIFKIGKITPLLYLVFIMYAAMMLPVLRLIKRR